MDEQNITLEHRITEVESRARSNTHRIDELKARQDDLDQLVSAVKVLADREERVESDLKEIKKDVKSLTLKPAKRWESLVSQLITLVVAAVAGYFFAKFGL